MDLIPRTQPVDKATGGNDDATRVSVRPGRPVTRYPVMSLLLASEPFDAADLVDVLGRHQEFIERGGGGGTWETIATTEDTEVGIVIGLYHGDVPKQGSQADLSCQRLVGLNLRGAQLPYADLSATFGRDQDLRGANLQGALVVDSDYAGANFEAADLSSADLSRSELMHCNFRGANLRDADLEQADLSGADLRGADISGARLGGAMMDGVLW